MLLPAQLTKLCPQEMFCSRGKEPTTRAAPTRLEPRTPQRSASLQPWPR